MARTNSQLEILAAEEYGKKLKRQGLFSQASQAEVASAFSFATMFDIETGGTDPRSPIYEMGFSHRGKGLKHYFVNPTNIEGTAHPEFSAFSKSLLSKRARTTSPGIGAAIEASPLGQREAAAVAHSELAGRDVWVQNLRFERSFLKERFGEDQFTNWARQSQLESFIPGSGLYESNVGIKTAIEDAKMASRGRPLDEFLGKWGNVFSQFETALDNPLQQGTRVFDMMDLTRSVFALAQTSGAMKRTGEIFTGTSIDALSQAAFGVKELHTAAGDAVLQGELLNFLYGTGLDLKYGRDLTSVQSGFFDRIGNMQPGLKHEAAKKNILDTFIGQQQFLATGDFEHLRRARTDFIEGERYSNLRVLQEDGSYANQRFARYARRDVGRAGYSTDIGAVVEAWKGRDAIKHGITPDYDRALREVQSAYIGPYLNKVDELGGDRVAALAAMEEQASAFTDAISARKQDLYANANVSKTTQASRWIQSNWKLGAGVAGAIALGGYLWSGSDDEYNYIEGMRHGGFAGDLRKFNTDFGSGWQGLASSAAGFVKSNPKTVAMMGAGAALGTMTYKADEDASILSAAKGFGVSLGMFAAAAVFLPPVTGAVAFGLASKASGGAISGGSSFGVLKGLWKANMAGLRGTYGAYKNIHTGQNAKDLFAQARAEGVDLSLGAKIKRFFTGPVKVGGKAAKHTAEWLGEHWAPQAEKLDPAAGLLALATGYEAANIVGDAANLDIGGVATGALTFAGAKYAYMGWHHREKIAKVWNESNRKDKLLLGATASGMLGNLASYIPEAIHANFAYARYGIAPKEFYKKFGGEVGVNVASEAYVIGDQLQNVAPHLSGRFKDVFQEGVNFYARGLKTAGERLSNVTREDIERGATDFGNIVDDLMSGSYFSGAKDQDLGRFGSIGKVATFFDDGKDSVIGGWVKQKTQEADFDSLFNSYDTLRKRTTDAIKNKRVQANTPFNPIDGMPHSGVAGATREGATDFGSPYQGLEHALNRRYDGYVATADVRSYNVEDADTVAIMMSGGNNLNLRLAGIDAPEIEHEDDYASGKVFQRQPYGRAATGVLASILAEQSNITAVFNPEGEGTYGRTPALLFGDDGLNINLELVKRGAAASLPFGRASDRLFDASAFNRAQEEAISAELGMWEDPGWRAAHNVQRTAKTKLTHNTFTDLEKLFSNFRASAVVHRLRNPDSDLAEMQAAGGRDDFNIIEGMQHGWFGSNRRANIGDFGSGYQVDKVINTMKLNTKHKRKLQQGHAMARTHVKRMMDPKSWTSHHIG